MFKKTTEVAFIDASVDELDALLAGLRPEVEGIVLGKKEPAPRQIQRELATRQNVTTVHIVAHGRPGAVHFAAGPLSISTLNEHASDLLGLGESLRNHQAPLLLWSCDTGAGRQ